MHDLSPMCVISAVFLQMVDESALDAVRYAMRNVLPRPPAHYDPVYKDECMFTFDTALSPGGLFINLASWQAFGAQYVALDHERSGNSLYLHEKHHKASSLGLLGDTKGVFARLVCSNLLLLMPFSVFCGNLSSAASGLQ